MFNPMFEDQPNQVWLVTLNLTWKPFSGRYSNPKKTSTEKYFWHDSLMMFSTSFPGFQGIFGVSKAGGLLNISTTFGQSP